MNAQTIWLGTRKGLFAITRTNGQWSVSRAEFLGVQVPIVLPSTDGQQVYACLKHGHFGSKVHRSDDGGGSWKEVGVPTYPEKPDRVPDTVDPMRNAVIPWSLDMIWSLEQTPDGKLWCGSLPGGLFTSDDDGDSWQLNEPLWYRPERGQWFGGGYDLPGIHSICIDPRNSHHVKIGISCGGVWATEDGGANWECRSAGMRADYMPPEQAYDANIQDPHRMVQCPASPDHHWVQHHNGIFRSTDNCQSWTELSNPQPSGFGFAVAVHPSDPQTAWFAPAVKDSDRYPVEGKLVVVRTSDGGQTFEVLSKGLPQQHAYHLIYRHSMEIDNTGNALAIGSTTGALWWSDDGGDSWETVTKDLPPIFCVRFSSN